MAAGNTNNEESQSGTVRIAELPGKVGVYRSDFDKHIKGTGFRQPAGTIDMNPVLSLPDNPITLQDTITKLYSIMLSQNDFVSIGDGISSFGTFTVGLNGNTTINDCFTAALNSPRFQNGHGGIILLKNGTYTFGSTVNLPAGISVIGETCTVINAHCPVFEIYESKNVSISTDTSSSKADGYFINKISNITFMDSQDLATPSLSASEFIIADLGSNVEITNCNFYGRVDTQNNITQNVVIYGTNVSIYNTLLKISNCVIYCVQQVVNFQTLSMHDKLTISKNRIWATGNKTTSTVNALISACGADIEISDNDILFGIYANNSNLQYAKYVLYCETSPGFKANLFIVNNKLKFTDTSVIQENNLVKFNNSITPATSANYIGIIRNNTTSGFGDHDWYIVVGDGINTIGDINGTNALETIYNCYFNQNNYSSSFTGGQVTIYVKPGEYTIGNNYFNTQTTGFNYSIIGLSDTANIPQISFEQSDGYGAKSKYLGNNIQNIYFRGINEISTIKLIDSYLENNNTNNTRHAFYTISKCINCVFENCKLESQAGYSSATYSELTNDHIDNLYVQDCKFVQTEAFTGIINNTAIYKYCPCPSNIVIKNCVLGNANYGSFLTIEGKENSKLTLENCVICSMNSANFILYTSNIKDINIKNCKFDISNWNVNVSEISSVMRFLNNSSTNPLSNFIFEHNIIIGTDKNVDLGLNYGLRIEGFNNIDIIDNTFEKLTIDGHIDISDIATETAHNVNIKNNKHISGANSFGFFEIKNINNTQTLPTNINIADNFIDMHNKYLNVRTVPILDGLFARGIIVIYDKNAIVNILNNTIYNNTANYAKDTSPETCIYCITQNAIQIIGNTISTTNTISSRPYFVIVAAPEPEAFGNELHNSTNNQLLTIEANKITTNISTETDGSYIVHIKDSKYINIYNNILFAKLSVSTYSQHFRFINIYSALDTTVYTEGLIYNNMFLSSNSDFMTKLVWVIYYPTAAGCNCAIRAYNNKGQITSQLIDCTNFKQYGFNTTKAFPVANNVDNYPNNKATLLLSSIDILANSDASNLNKQQNTIITAKDYNTGTDSLIISGWADLPKGLYYTNVVPNGCDPAVGDTHVKHQVLIPLNIPDNIKLLNISIPIYINNQDTVARTVSAGASIIYSNYDGNFEYIKDGSSGWANVDKPLNTNSVGSITLELKKETLLENNYILNANRSYGVEQKCYLLLGIQSTSSGNIGVNSKIFFAIPYVKVDYMYC